MKLCHRFWFLVFQVLFLPPNSLAVSPSFEEELPEYYWLDKYDRNILYRLQLRQRLDPCSISSSCSHTLIPSMVCVNSSSGWRCECDPGTDFPVNLNGYRTCGRRQGQLCKAYTPLPPPGIINRTLYKAQLEQSDIDFFFNRYTKVVDGIDKAFPPQYFSPLDLACATQFCDKLRNYRCAKRPSPGDADSVKVWSMWALISVLIFNRLN